VLARELADFVEALTGQRVSRLVQCDASQFWSQWFGETEARINTFFEKLSKLGRLTLHTRDGREVAVPLLVVLEEAEALFRSRSEADASSHLFDRPLALLLQKMDALTAALDVPLVVCSTSNRPDLLDAAARRRLGVRQVMFGHLGAGQAASVLLKKLPPGLPLRAADGREPTRDEVVRRVVAFLYGPDPDQGVAEVRLLNAGRRTIHRRELVTGALLEQAVSTAIDDAIRLSGEAGELLGVDAEGVIAALEEQFDALARSIRPHNLREHCPDLFADGPVHAEDVRPLTRTARRPRAALLR
jgi:SpoVK/Ycf46/Vps4 family AAA+-type ATPase